MEYRIIQLGKKVFKVQIYVYTTKGFLWWKKKKWSWMPTNCFGGVWFIDTTLVIIPISGSFKSLEGAQKRIDEWNFKPIIHE